MSIRNNLSSRAFDWGSAPRDDVFNRELDSASDWTSLSRSSSTLASASASSLQDELLAIKALLSSIVAQLQALPALLQSERDVPIPSPPLIAAPRSPCSCAFWNSTSPDDWDAGFSLVTTGSPPSSTRVSAPCLPPPDVHAYRVGLQHSSDLSASSSTRQPKLRLFKSLSVR